MSTLDRSRATRHHKPVRAAATLVTVALIATGFVTTNGSRSTFLLGRDTAIPVLDRLFLDSRLSFGYFDEFESYVDGTPGFPDERAGSNDSHEDNFVRTEGNDNYSAPMC